METKNYRAGRQIRSIEELFDEEIVFVSHWKRISPVAFIMSMQARQVYHWTRKGVFYHAVKKEHT